MEGPPVEILEARTGQPFVVIAGVRVPIRNLPLPHPVGASTLDGLPEGPPLDVARAGRAAPRSGGSAGKLKDLVRDAGRRR